MSTKPFITDTFLLKNKFAEELYFRFAENQPIIDYHNHLPPKEIAENRQFENITQVWIGGDHYKWRAMRTMGVNEKFITGDASDKEKFAAWAKTVPNTLRNPLFHWTHLELARYFDVYDLLSEKNADQVYENVSAQLQTPEKSVRGLLKMRNVETVCTTEDPIDTLEYHQALKNDNFGIKVSTAFRPDKAILIDNEDYNSYIDKLGESAGIEINSYKDVQDALIKRIEYFHANGCRLCDHGLNNISFETFTDSEINSIFETKRKGETLTPHQIEQFKTAILLFLGETYHSFGWVQQYHLGALRNNNARMLKVLGPDTGWDSIGDFGSGWWFLDQKDGMEKQMNALSNMGLISTFVGMLTDSRSFLSFPRHEYFRRVLCNLLGNEIESGELPEDLDLVGKVVADICYFNAKEYFNF